MNQVRLQCYRIQCIEMQINYLYVNLVQKFQYKTHYMILNALYSGHR